MKNIELEKKKKEFELIIQELERRRVELEALFIEHYNNDVERAKQEMNEFLDKIQCIIDIDVEDDFVEYPEEEPDPLEIPEDDDYDDDDPVGRD